MVLWEITLATAYILGLKRTYRIVLRLERRLLSNRPRLRDFVHRRVRTVFDVALRVHRTIQQRDIAAGKSFGNWLLRMLDRVRPSANIRGEGTSSPSSSTTKKTTDGRPSSSSSGANNSSRGANSSSSRSNSLNFVRFDQPSYSCAGTVALPIVHLQDYTRQSVPQLLLESYWRPLKNTLWQNQCQRHQQQRQDASWARLKRGLSEQATWRLYM